MQVSCDSNRMSVKAGSSQTMSIGTCYKHLFDLPLYLSLAGTSQALMQRMQSIEARETRHNVPLEGRINLGSVSMTRDASSCGCHARHRNYPGRVSA